MDPKHPHPLTDSMMSVMDVHDRMTLRRNNLQSNYSAVVSRCRDAIQRAATKLQYSCCFEVPEFMLGVPCYHINDCIRHVMHVLVTNGYRVTYYFPRILWISWGGGHDSARLLAMTTPALGDTRRSGGNVLATTTGVQVRTTPTGKISLDFR